MVANFIASPLRCTVDLWVAASSWDEGCSFPSLFGERLCPYLMHPPGKRHIQNQKSGPQMAGGQGNLECQEGLEELVIPNQPIQVEPLEHPSQRMYQGACEPRAIVFIRPIRLKPRGPPIFWIHFVFTSYYNIQQLHSQNVLSWRFLLTQSKYFKHVNGILQKTLKMDIGLCTVLLPTVPTSGLQLIWGERLKCQRGAPKTWKPQGLGHGLIQPCVTP